MNKRYIGIVGGVGPYAGLELQKAILRHTQASRDQEYVPVITISAPHEIPDRTDFILGKTSENPAHAIIEQIHTLYSCGARYIGIPCNTVHSDVIFSVIKEGVKRYDDMILVNMIDETFREIKRKRPDAKTIGVLATRGSYKSNLFRDYGAAHRYEIIIPEKEESQEEIHRSIYDEVFGIKALGFLDVKAREIIDRALEDFKDKYVQSVILGCTELSVVFQEEVYKGITLIDPIAALAAKLVSLYNNGTTP